MMPMPQNDNLPTPAQREAILGTLMHNARNPKYPPTLQVRAIGHGAYVDYYPLNPLASMLFDAFGRAFLTAEALAKLKDCGFDVEVRS